MIKEMPQLLVIPTPIGNMSDVSDHMREALSSVDVLLCESLSKAKSLYQLLDIKLPKLIRYWQKTEQMVINQIDTLGDKVGLISDAGMPCISDPGYLLVEAWHAKGYPVSVIPGPSAVVVAAALSGIATDSFQFLGFLPPKSKACQDRLLTLSMSGMAGIVYESPHRITRLCEDIISIYGEDHLICVMRELSKKFETYYRGKAADVLQALKSAAIKGEFSVVISKRKAEPSWQKDAKILMAYLSVSAAAEACAKIHQISKSEIYTYLLKLQ